MIPPFLIDEVKKQDEKNEWQPEELRLPLYEPPPQKRTIQAEDDAPKRGVLILDISTGEIIDG